MVNESAGTSARPSYPNPTWLGETKASRESVRVRELSPWPSQTAVATQWEGLAARAGGGATSARVTPEALNLREIWEDLARLAAGDADGPRVTVPSLFGQCLELVRLLAERAVASGAGWNHPHVGLLTDDEIALEWWRGNRKVTVYLTPTGVDYLRSWGPDMDREMSEAPLREQDIDSMWLWLMLPSK